MANVSAAQATPEISDIPVLCGGAEIDTLSGKEYCSTSVGVGDPVPVGGRTRKVTKINTEGGRIVSVEVA